MQKSIQQLVAEREDKYALQAKLTRELIELDIEIAKRIKMISRWERLQLG